MLKSLKGCQVVSTTKTQVRTFCVEFTQDLSHNKYETKFRPFLIIFECNCKYKTTYYRYFTQLTQCET